MQKTKQQGFTAIEIVLVVALVAVIGVAGYQAWQNFHKAKSPTPTATPGNAAKARCAANETESAANGTFCSTQIGIKFVVPEIFKGKLSNAPNYEVFKGTIDEGLEASSAGESEAVFSGQITGNDNFTLTIAKEPLRSGYAKVSHGLQSTYFDQATGVLSVINGATYYYNSATETTTQTGKPSLGAAVPSFTVGDIRFYKADSGDAGVEELTYFAVIKGNIIKIGLTHKGYIGDPTKDPTTINWASVFKSLDDGIKKLQNI